MNAASPRNLRNRVSAGAVALGLFVVAGCQGHKVVARVNNQPINQDEYVERVERVTQIPQSPGIDAGGWALVQMITELLTDQLAQQMHAVPSDDAVQRYADYNREKNPEIQTAIRSGALSDDVYLRSVRVSLEEFGIGTDGAQADPTEIQTTYKDNIAKFTIPVIWTVKSMPVPNAQVGDQLIEQLKRTGDFRSATRALGGSAAAVAAAGQEVSFQADKAKPAIRDALMNLTDGNFASKTIVLEVPADAQNPTPRTVYMIMQLVRKTMSRVPTVDEIRPLLQELVLNKKQPAWQQHEQQQLAEFTRASAPAIQIDILRYQPLVQEYILPQAESRVATAPGGTLGPPGGGSMAPGGMQIPSKIQPPTR